MTKKELIALVKELNELDDLSKRGKDIEMLRNEARRMAYHDDESFQDKLLTDEFEKYYALLINKVSSFTLSTLEEKKALLEKARKLLNEKNIKNACDEMNDIFNAFKNSGHVNKETDDSMWNELKDIREKLNTKRQEYYDNIKANLESNKKEKEALIKKANDALNLESLKEINNIMNSLMDEWKKIGSAGKENDDPLWNKFNEARQAFYDKRKAYNEEMTKMYNEKALKKQEIIKKAKMLLANSEFSEEEVNKIKELRNSWKEIGFSGKDNEDKLWEEFNFTINKYFSEMKFYKN